MARWFSGFALMFVLLSPARDAHAQETSADVEARNLFLAGQNAFGSGNYARAVEYFEQAHALSHRSGLLYNIAFAADRLRSDARALEAYRAYLEAEPATPRRAEVESRIAFLEAALAAPDPEPEPEPQSPAEPAPASEPVLPASSAGFHPAAIISLVGGGVLLATFGVFAALSEVEDQALASRCGRDAGASCSPSALETLRSLNTIADVSWVAGAALAVTGVVLLFALPAERSADLAFAPWVAPEGAGVTAVGQW